MGIDMHSLNLLCHARKTYGDLGNTITLGRLAVLLGPRAAIEWTGTSRVTYCEGMLMEKFGALRVDSIDKSGYEGATIIADMNQPVPKNLKGQYDTVLDFGCTEHIFDVAQSLRNITSLCRPGGMILHAVPANGFCGHGFYQFSPELFFTWYSVANGYANTEILLADLMDTKHWYQVHRPGDGERINVRSSDEMYVMVIAKHVAHSDQPIQQSDYAFTWASSEIEAARTHSRGRLAQLREMLFKHKFTARVSHRIDSLISRYGTKTLRRHPALTRIRITPN